MTYSSLPSSYIPVTPVIPGVPVAYRPDLPLIRQPVVVPPVSTSISPRSADLSSIFCGDGTLSGAEECDDGNTRALDGCSEQCRLETGGCGDGVLQAGFGEQCDEGASNGTADSLCSSTCKIIRTPRCGDGTQDPGEECDLGQRNADAPLSLCLFNCLLPYCGDGLLGAGEQCDDGNQFSLDGCDSSCRFEQQLAAPSANVPDSTSPIGTPLSGSLTDVRRIPTPAKTPSGPGLAIFLASGAAAGIGLVRRRLRK